ncbi:hypothetical protein R3P38DRAFT_3243499 [Favolaschia claudopus]|uniref:Cyclochlorotine biosynthesis protein O n=1 Tax=Favolaschia claudopus TaxID=2862362 RepID=A0AAV9Z375_9AGAR
MPPTYQLLPHDSEGKEKYSLLHSLRSPSFRLVLVLIGIICVQALALGVLLSRRRTLFHPDSKPSLVYSPVQHLVEETLKVYPLGFGNDLSPFQVPSSSALDKAWEDLYDFGISRIPKSEAAKLPNKTSPIPGDPGYYIAELDVFHELHCLNMIRMALDPEYYPEWNIKLVQRSREHVSHCVDWLRESIMCHVDISVIVWQWNDRVKQSTPKARIPHVCRKFEPIWEWGRENAMRVDYNFTVRIEDGLPEPPIFS